MNYRMPPEWAPHDRCWMAWPCRHAVWTDREATARSYAAVAHAIARFYAPFANDALLAGRILAHRGTCR